MRIFPSAKILNGNKGIINVNLPVRMSNPKFNLGNENQLTNQKSTW